jgi:hypothetical protein
MELALHMDRDKNTNFAIEAAISDLKLNENRFVRAVYRPSQREMLGRMSDGLDRIPTESLVLISRDSKNLVFDVTSGSDSLGKNKITASEIARMGLDTDSLIIIHGNTSAAKNLKSLQRIVGEFNDVDPNLLMRVIQENSGIADAPRAELVEKINALNGIDSDAPSSDRPQRKLTP